MFIESKCGNFYIKTLIVLGEETSSQGKQLSFSGGYLRDGLGRAREQSAFNNKAVVKSTDGGVPSPNRK